MKEISVRTSSRVEMVDITSQIRDVIRESDTQEGICTIYCPHTTVAITINENADPDVASDILMKLNKLVPYREGYSHMEGNADAHIKSTLVVPSRLSLKMERYNWEHSREYFFVNLMDHVVEECGLV